MKHLLSQDLVSEVLAFCNDIHSSKIELINQKLHHRFDSENLVEIDKVTENIKLVDSVTGSKNDLSSHYKREQYIRNNFKFVEPQRITIGNMGNKPQFYYYLPIQHLKDLNSLFTGQILSFATN